MQPQHGLRCRPPRVLAACTTPAAVPTPLRRALAGEERSQDALHTLAVGAEGQVAAVQLQGIQLRQREGVCVRACRGCSRPAQAARGQGHRPAWSPAVATPAGAARPPWRPGPLAAPASRPAPAGRPACCTAHATGPAQTPLPDTARQGVAVKRRRPGPGQRPLWAHRPGCSYLGLTCAGRRCQLIQELQALLVCPGLVLGDALRLCCIQNDAQRRERLTRVADTHRTHACGGSREGSGPGA